MARLQGVDTPFPVRNTDFGPLEPDPEEPETCAWCHDPLPADARRLPNDQWLCAECHEPALEDFAADVVPQADDELGDTICLGCGIDVDDMARPVPGGGVACPDCYRDVLSEVAYQVQLEKDGVVPMPECQSSSLKDLLV